MKGNRNMKRVLAILLTIALLTVLVGCDKKEQPKDTQAQTTAAPAVETTNAPEEETTVVPEETTAPEQVVDEDVFSFTYQGVTLVPGNAFDSAALPEAESVYQVPSCAIEGTDNVYSYGDIEVTAFNDGNGEVIYSVYIVDANTPTAEGLYIGDTLDQVIAVYGEDYTQENGQVTYQKGDTLLVIILDGDYVASIDFRWAV
jgi:hypothetical protein